MPRAPPGAWLLDFGSRIDLRTDSGSDGHEKMLRYDGGCFGFVGGDTGNGGARPKTKGGKLRAV